MQQRLLNHWVIGFVSLILSSYCFSVSGQTDQWSDLILEHNIQTHSRSLPIRIRFQQDITDVASIGSRADAYIDVESQSDWTSEFTTRREILIQPKTAWISGERIDVVLKASAFPMLPRKVEDYPFSVNVIEQNFEIRLHGLTMSNQNDQAIDFSGTLSTTDRETNESIQKVMTASLSGEPINIEWQHSANGLVHHFEISNISKQASSQRLSLDWNMAAIGLKETGSREILIPMKNDFTIASIHQYRDGYPVIRVTFTDNLAEDQNLKGLVQLNGKDVKFNVVDNQINIPLATQFKGDAKVSISAGIESENGLRLIEPVQKFFSVGREKPQVRFIGQGVILPDNEFLTIPFETMNVKSIQVTAFEVFDHNIGQFLQSNQLNSSDGLHRVGRYLWRKTIELPEASVDKWQNFNLDATELFKQSPGSLFRLTLSINRGNSLLLCNKEQADKPVVVEKAFKNFESDYTVDASSWDFAEDYFNVSGNRGDTSDPCNDSYYNWSKNAKASKNFMASNIGVIAKGDSSNRFSVITTDIASAQPLNNTLVDFYNFQNQRIASLETNDDGFGEVQLPSKPFYLLTRNGDEQGVLRLEDNASLPVSHFDVGGQKIEKGIKATIFSERGVWRPGDDIHLTFVLSDEAGALPENHPVTMRLYDPRNRLVTVQTNAKPVGHFYRFDLTTEDDAPTGNWEVRATIGGAEFSKKLKIETVQPNRLKVELDFGEEDTILFADEPLQGHLFSQWLHGATASELNADVSVTLSPLLTYFSRGEAFIFDDPTRVYRGRKQQLVNSKLDKDGNLSFDAEISQPNNAAGMMSANFVSKVYESTGQFSIATQREKFSPYQSYVGIKLPKGDAARGMLLTDIDHTVDILSLDAEGKPKELKKVSVSLHKIHWRWWWEKGADSLGQYSQTQYNQGIAHGVVSTDENGIAQWDFKVTYPSWGRYMVRACDMDGGHCSAKVVYIDWPGWAGRAQESKGVGASALTLTTDKPNYIVGDVAKVTLPAAQTGRALISIENGSEIVSQVWREMDGDIATIDVPITSQMAPNVYVSVTLLQPHSGKNNDRPIRMIGIVPILVEDPQTRLEPALQVPEVWGSNRPAEILVSEKDGHPMTYSVMVVDEGLLGLTRFRTPDLHKEFYKREALGITTWDMFDEVVGAYGGELERLLALGGGDSGEDENAETKKKRFPPVVKVMGPFKLAAGETATHSFDMPQYLGQVRVMVVANQDAAYGSTDEQVFVREAINLLPTLPRAVSPGESVVVPTLVFRNDQKLADISLEITVLEGDASIVGDTKLDLQFDDSNEQIALFNLNVGDRLDWLKIQFTARAGEAEFTQVVDLPVVSATTPTTTIINRKLAGGEIWEVDVEPHGIAGSNNVTVNLSGAIPFNLENRLKYLIRYPHGCIEQTTSSVFPQLYLNDLMTLSSEEATKVENNIRAAINRIASFQTSNGGFAYWPGLSSANEWGSNYAGHFLAEAIAAGYSVPNELYSPWLDYQKEMANSWTASSQSSSTTNQAYRLYTLVLANEADFAAMNRLRVLPNLGKTASLILAEAYYRYGLVEVANSIDTTLPSDFTEQDDRYTYGSDVRNQAIAMRSAVVRGDDQQADLLAEQLGEYMASDHWYSTQTVAYTLLAFSEYLTGNGNGVKALIDIEGFDEVSVNSEKTIVSLPLPQIQDDAQTVLISNDLQRPIYASISVEGLPEPGNEVAVANKLSLQLDWLDEEGKQIDSVQSLKQGRNISLNVTVSNDTKRDIENLALTQVFPSGWEIENKRLEGQEQNEVFDYQDIRDDRVLTYFSLAAGQTRTYNLTLHMTYAGVFYLPGTHVEAMYDNSYQAATVGQWVEVSR